MRNNEMSERVGEWEDEEESRYVAMNDALWVNINKPLKNLTENTPRSWGILKKTPLFNQVTQCSNTTKCEFAVFIQSFVSECNEKLRMRMNCNEKVRDWEWMRARERSEESGVEWERRVRGCTDDNNPFECIDIAVVLLLSLFFWISTSIRNSECQSKKRECLVCV
jgi:hypothetical protein